MTDKERYEAMRDENIRLRAVADAWKKAYMVLCDAIKKGAVAINPANIEKH